ncbi:hypothetical protein Aperf_G00000130457 [Anoplocephala perfoliata]
MKTNDFDVACDFYKAQVNKAFTLSYEQKLTLSALFNQAKHGPFSLEKAPEVGLFDFVGKERRAKWQSLGDMTTAEAQDTFVQTLLQICPQFAAHLEANDIIPCLNSSEIEPVDCTDLPPTVVHGMNSHSPTYASSSKLERKLTPNQESHIRNALNAQTLKQFRAYAAQYYPDNEEKQTELIAQLQDRHFHQYMIYISENPSLQAVVGVSPSTAASKEDGSSLNVEQANPSTRQQTMASSETISVKNAIPETTAQNIEDALTNADKEPSDQVALVARIPNGKDNIEAPQMWTRSDIIEFKALLSKDPNSVINVGSGELVTIRFPVDSKGNCLVWEFATDDYDIGFGLSFEWPPETKVRNGRMVDESQQSASDGEASDGLWKFIQGSSQPPEGDTGAVVDELIPVYRRTSHTEVYCGSHNYPSHSGTYILKFDNTYSYWRNKLLYYRVYWTQ